MSVDIPAEGDIAINCAIISENSAELRRKSIELQKRSNEIRERCRLMNSKMEDVIKRAEAAGEAARLAQGNRNYILKKCGGCGKHYKVMEWFSLPFTGYQEAGPISGEMRQCGCDSTLLFITRGRTAA